MDISSFLQASLKIAWVIAVLSALILIIGWILSRWIARIVVSLLNRTRIISAVARGLKLSNVEWIYQSIHQSIRFLVILLALWGSWQTLNSHPDIARAIQGVQEAIVGFVRLQIVIFVFDLALIGLATFALFRALGWVRAGRNLLIRRILAEQGRRLNGLKIQRLQIFTASQLVSFLSSVIRYARYGVNVLLILIYFTGVFSLFPQTRGVVYSILNNIFLATEKGWQGFLAYLPNLVNLILVIVITHYALRLMRFIFEEIEKGTITFSGFHPEWAIPTYQLVRFLIIALALVVAFPYLPGSSSPAFQGISVFLGLLLSLGSSSVVSNIVSGVVLIYARAFQVGDRVQIADTVGDVIEKSLLVTRVRTIKNVEVTIPNGMVLGSHIINYSSVSKDQELILNTTVTLGYDIPWRLIHKTLIEAAQATNGILPKPHPFVLQTSLDDFYVSYELNAYTDQPNKMAMIYSELHQNIQDHCNEAGIEILSPHYDALRDGNPSSIPSDYLPKDYRPPRFEVKVSKDDK